MVALSTAAKFKASGHDTKRAFADHVRRYVNVRGFGALGDGVHDDWHAIQSAVNWAASQRGTLYFPPGTYKVSQSIAHPTNGVVLNIEGEPGAVITGNFADYIIKFLYDAAATSGSQRGVIERLRLLNTHASGGGIRYATCSGGTIRDCIITANQGINTSIDNDTWVAFEVSILNCHLDPGDNAANSNGLLLASDGPVSNCTVTGFACGARLFAGQGSMYLNGCRFKTCAIGIAPGTLPPGTNDSVQAWVMLGCTFVNCGTHIYFPAGGGGCRVGGIQIEATEGAIAGNPQYGIRLLTLVYGMLWGINVTGQYQVAGVVYGADTNNRDNFFAGIGVVNTSSLGGVTWSGFTHGTFGSLIACNKGLVITTVPSGASNLFEGTEFNVSNSNTATWGATYATGGSNRVKVRYNGTNWTVVGK